VIRLHDLGREELPAIRARPAALEAKEPLGSLALPYAAWNPNTTKAFVAVVIDQDTASLAVRLHPVTTQSGLVELRQRLRFAAPRATFHLVLAHPFDINIDIDVALRRRHSHDEFVTMPA
jgi:hypothetical protein